MARQQSTESLLFDAIQWIGYESLMSGTFAPTLGPTCEPWRSAGDCSSPDVSEKYYNLLMLPQITFRMKGTTGLLVAAVIIVALLIWFPGYWLFFAISVGLGVVIALLLFLRNKYFPVSDKEVENKHPLGLE